VKPQDDPNGLHGLDFSTAAAEGRGTHLACVKCYRQILGSYFEVDDEVVCEECRYAAESAANEGSPAGRCGRALAAGLCGAVVGAGIYYAARALTGYEIGLIAIVVGVLVGAGVRWGARGRGGWAYQTLAIVLTYLAIVSTYVPFFAESSWDALMEGWHSKDWVLGEVEAGSPDPDAASDGLPAREGAIVPVSDTPSNAASSEPLEPGPAVKIVFGAALFVMALVAPFMFGLQSVLGLAIIGLALYQAWKLNKRQQLIITGPYAVGSGAPAPAPIELAGEGA
jgi:hypothetical protein